MAVRVIRASRAHGENLVRSMFTGRKRDRGRQKPAGSEPRVRPARSSTRS
jgi:hypothetical protein